MTTKIKRKLAGLFPWLRGAAFGTVTFAALAPLTFYPVVAVPVAALAIAICGAFAPSVAVLLFVIALAIPLMASNILVGTLFLLLGLAMVTYLGGEDGRAFLVIALAFAAVLVRAEWGVAVLAGYLLGSGDGAVVAFGACLTIEIAGLLLGKPGLGVIATGGSGRGLIDLGLLARLSAAGDALTFAWIAPAIEKMKPGALLDMVTGIRHIVLFIAQPFVWASAAGVAGMLSRPVGDPKRPVFGLIAAAAGVGALALVSTGLMLALGGPVALPDLLVATASSLALALAGVALSEWVFAPYAVSVGTTRVATSAEDADVDDLLRMISSAEEELTSKHTAHRTVMITDMKAFSRITQERGSVLTAKLVQRHRDLCLPLIASKGGKGKSSGGDGLIAAFDDPASALAAAVEMQQALHGYNASRPGDEEILVRVGIAEGEVVLDKGGKPFLGDGLNLAARVMGLADGGQVFTTGTAAAKADALPYGSVEHGSFRLKNITEPVDLVEVLWREGQLPSAPLSLAEEAPDEAADAPLDAAGEESDAAPLAAAEEETDAPPLAATGEEALPDEA